MYTKEDWNKRAQKHGHTGHSEPFWYCFDQQARLYAISSVLRSIFTEKKLALDFGCGSGDFVELLSNHFRTIYGYDYSDVMIRKTRLRFRDPEIKISDTLEIPKGTVFDLILSVDVLRSLSLQELNNNLALLSSLLGTNGSMVAMEFFAPDDTTNINGKTVTTDSDWHATLQKNNLKIVSTLNFYNPVELPSRAWLAYKNDLVLRGLRLFKHFAFMQRLYSRVAKDIIGRYRDVVAQAESPYKIYVLKKA